MLHRLAFRIMSLEFRLRDRLHPPLKLLREAGVREGMNVVDFGCGPGGFALAAAGIAGSGGRIYAADIDPLALDSVRRSAKKRGYENIRTIRGSSPADIPGEDIDVVLLYDVLHELSDPDAILGELHRVLKPKGVLSVSDHHLKEPEIVSRISGKGLFGFAGRGRRIFRFEKSERPGPAV